MKACLAIFLVALSAVNAHYGPGWSHWAGPHGPHGHHGYHGEGPGFDVDFGGIAGDILSSVAGVVAGVAAEAGKQKTETASAGSSSAFLAEQPYVSSGFSAGFTNYFSAVTNGQVKFEFAGAGLRRVRSNFVQGNNVFSLSFRDNDIEYVEREAFVAVPYLRALDLSGNRLPWRRFFDFGNYNLLGEIKLDNNRYASKSAASEAFVGPEHPFLGLRNLSMRNAGIRGFTEGALEYFPYLNFLDVSDNPLDLVKFFVTLPPSTQMLYLENTDFDRFCLGSFPVPKFPALKNVRALYLGRNKFSTVTGAEGACSAGGGQLNLFYPFENQLQLISLARTNLRSIDQSAFDYFPQLRSLDLSYNSLLSLEEATFAKLKSLEEFDLSGNPLVRFPNFSYFPNLKVLKLEEMQNKVAFLTVSEDNFNLKQLRELSLAGNQFRAVPEMIFKNIEYLERLDLSRNLIKQIDVNWAFASSLRDINLSANQFYNFETINVNEAKALRRVEFGDNPISEFSPSVMSRFPEYIRIAYQPSARAVCQAY